MKINEMNINLDPDTITALSFFVFTLIIILLFAVINSSYKNTENNDPNTTDFGSQLLVMLLVIGFITAVYSYNNMFLFIAAIALIVILVV